MSELLAGGFVAAGHEVRVLTKSAASRALDDKLLPFRVFRNPGVREVWRLVADSDVVFHNNVCLRYAWPLMFLRRPWTVATHTWIRRNNGRRGFRDWLKLQALRFATLISASSALAADLGLPSVTVANAFNNTLFVLTPEVERIPGSMVFVGRLVSAKGVHILLESMATLRREGHVPSLTIIGDGQERTALERMVLDFDLVDQARFTGPLKGHELVRELNRHDIMVIPSVWDEPFGVVALEGAACGCYLVGTANGGLAEAIGACGSVVPNGNSQALAAEIRRVLGALPVSQEFRELRDRHLQQHSPEAMVRGYLAVLNSTRRPPGEGIGHRRPRREPAQ